MRRSPVWAIYVALVCSACGPNNFLQLPDDPEAASWLLLAGSKVAVFDADAAMTADPDVRLRLASLPVAASELGASPSGLNLDGGRRVAVRRSFEYLDEAWAETAPLTITTAFDRDQCVDNCLLTFTCETCDVRTTQGCGPCTPSPVSPPTLPTSECPDGWLAETFDDGHYECFMPKSTGYATPCDPDSRWSQQDAACVALACEAPTLPPATMNVTYVDASATQPGDGSESRPFVQVPTTALSGLLVLRPGTYPRLQIESPGLQVVGHGPCSRVDDLQVDAAGVAVEGLSLGTVKLNASATATITASSVSTTHVAIDADGYLRLVDTKVEATEPLAAAIVTRSGLSITGGDIAGTVRSEGLLAVRDTRIVADANTDGAPAVMHSGPRFDADNSTFIGAAAVVIETGDAVLRDVMIESYSSANQALLMEGDSLVLERADVHASRVGVELNRGRLELSDIRITADRGVYSAEREIGASLEFHRGWINGQRSGIYYRNDIKLFDIWLRRPGDGTSVLKSGAIDVTDNRLEAYRIHILGYGQSAIEASGHVRIEDLTASGRHGLFIIEEVGSSRELIGKRWSIEAADVGVTLPIQWDLEDVRFAPQAGALAFVPVCARARTPDSSLLTRFSLEPSPGVPSIVLDEAGVLWTGRAVDGHLFTPVLGYGDLCRGEFDAYDGDGWFDRVMIETRP